VQACRRRGAPARAAVCCAIASVVLTLGALPAEARVYTLDECIEIALENNTSLAGAREDLEAARAGVLSSWSGVLPHVSAGLTKGEHTDVTGGEDTSWDSFSGSLSLSQTLLDGATFARIAGSHRSRTATELALEATRRQTVFDTKQGYYGLLRATQLRDVQAEAVELAREQLRKTQSLFDLGSASRSDLLKAQVQVGESELALIAAEKSAATARAGLAFVLGIDVTTDIEAADTEASLEEEISDYDIETAISSRPDIRAWEESVVASKRSLLASKAARWPDLGLSVSYSRGTETFEQFREDMSDDYSRNINLSLSVPIFNGLSTKASIDNSKSSLRSLEIALRNARLSAAYEIETASLAVDEGKRSVAVAEQSVLQAEEDLKVSEERFRLRAASMLELIDSRVAYSRARADLVNSRYDYELAKAELKLALGL
jgi:outer membrane protein TolC